MYTVLTPAADRFTVTIIRLFGLIVLEIGSVERNTVTEVEHLGQGRRVSLTDFMRVMQGGSTAGIRHRS